MVSECQLLKVTGTNVLLVTQQLGLTAELLSQHEQHTLAVTSLIEQEPPRWPSPDAPGGRQDVLGG